MRDLQSRAEHYDSPFALINNFIAVSLKMS